MSEQRPTFGARKNPGSGWGVDILWPDGETEVAAISAVGSMILYLPVFAFLPGSALAGAPLSDLALQALVQGVLTAIISLLLYGRAVSILGASSGAAFAAVCPVMTALLGIPILGEWPTMLDWAAISLISAGVYIVSGGPIPRNARALMTDAARDPR